ncbi:hypothetical protein JOB18_037506 [Solea senegalensis]|uniref:Uncharacterized protein n=1 Tax=Solea senegalensis TaxID=28829 RepID=A0AAV6PFM3_SOLSE|nr:hypothetical protein JOB18_037506 [Solea senegalensis]
MALINSSKQIPRLGFVPRRPWSLTTLSVLSDLPRDAFQSSEGRTCRGADAIHHYTGNAGVEMEQKTPRIISTQRQMLHSSSFARISAFRLHSLTCVCSLTLASIPE